jgi:hypothetical protein
MISSVGSSIPTIHERRPAMMYDHYVSIHGYGIGPLHLLIVAALIIVPFWQLFTRAGYSGWLGFLMVVPIVNVLALYFLAFSDWPALRKKPTAIT